MKPAKIGMILNGGGARGAYQLGVFLALEKYNLTPMISALSGGSIGVFTELAFLMHDYRRAYNLFCELNSEKVLGQKDNFTNKVPVLGQGVFSRSPLVSYVNKHIDLRQLVDTDIPIFASVARVDKKPFKIAYSPEYFQLNHLEHSDVLQIALATSAIPRIFDEVKIYGNTYVDCLKADNEPYAPLAQYDLDAIFVIPLTNSHDPRKLKSVNIPVVDFESPVLRNSPMINMLGFEPDKVDSFLNCGYFTALAILDSLKQNGILDNIKEKLPPYTSLNTLGLVINPQRLLTIEEILEDTKRGPKL